jgi:hypothetical protein
MLLQCVLVPGSLAFSISSQILGLVYPTLDPFEHTGTFLAPPLLSATLPQCVLVPDCSAFSFPQSSPSHLGSILTYQNILLPLLLLSLGHASSAFSCPDIWPFHFFAPCHSSPGWVNHIRAFFSTLSFWITPNKCVIVPGSLVFSFPHPRRLTWPN